MLFHFSYLIEPFLRSLFGGDRSSLYKEVQAKTVALKKTLAAMPEDPHKGCAYATTTLKPAMDELRAVVDASELLCKADLWPYPTYTDICYSHHTK